MNWTSYSVGAYTVNGGTMGGSYGTESKARETFAHYQSLPQTASVSLYGWNDDTGECEELDTWAAG